VEVPDQDYEAVARREAERRRRQEELEARWPTTGWGAVGVAWCVLCANPFDGAAFVYDDLFGRRTYACGKCMKMSRYLYTPRPCEVCGREFAWVGGQLQVRPYGVRPRPRPRRHICSTICAREHRRQLRRIQHEQRKCAGCGDPFTPKRADSIYCSGACRTRAYRERHAAQ
jgi:hypothetical protein